MISTFAHAIILCVFSTARTERVVPLRIATITVGESPLYGYSTNSPAYDVALYRAKQMYPRIFRDFQHLSFYRPGNYSTCKASAGEMAILLGNYYSAVVGNARNEAPTKTIIVSPSCSYAIFQVGDFGRELDNAVFASMATDNSLSDDERYPTVLAIGLSARYSLVQTTLALLRHFSWGCVSVIGDLRSGDPVFSSALSLYDGFVKEYLSSQAGINSLIQNIDSTKSTDFGEILKIAALHSSIILIFTTTADVYLNILGQAIRWEMDNGKYVFIITQFGDLPLEPGTMLNRDNVRKTNTTTILPYVFEITTQPLDPVGFEEEWQHISTQSMLQYNTKIKSNLRYSGVQISAYESILMIAEVFNETYDIFEQISAKDFSFRFCNRTFALPTENVTISITGTRVVTTLINLYHDAEQTFKMTWKFANGEMKLFDQTLDWPTRWKGAPFPPNAEPSCHEMQACFPPLKRTGWDSVRNYLFLFFLLTVCLYPVYVSRKVVRDNKKKWWNLDLALIDYNFPKSAGIGQFPFAVGGHPVNQVTLDGRELAYQLASYNGELVQVLQYSSEVSYADIAGKKHALAILQQIRHLDHPNIARFYGIGFMASQKLPRQVVIVNAAPRKGLLRDLIDSQDLAFNWDFRASLIWDVLKGLQYIHDSPLRFHGTLNFLNLIIDQHFTLKISRTGSMHLFEVFRDLTRKTGFPIPVIANLWLAPEALYLDESSRIKPDIPSDSFSLGVILYEICSRNTPFDVDPTDLESIQAQLEINQSGKLDVEAYSVATDVPYELFQLAKKCWTFNPVTRPTVAEVANTLLNLYPDSDMSIADGIMNRLEHYNQELEATVKQRKSALKVERKKVDILLSNILPKSIVKQLRNGDPAVQDFFASVTILFSDIPAFNDMVAICAPFSIVEFLHRLYSELDEVISKRDVYKVETIKDSYMVASGLPDRNGDRHAVEISRVALKILDASSNVSSPIEYVPICRNPRLRIGIHTGPCVAAVIGQKQPRYCLVGDTINTASRMETNGEELKIHITADTKTLLDGKKLFQIIERGLMTIKGKGDMVTYWLSELPKLSD